MSVNFNYNSIKTTPINNNTERNNSKKITTTACITGLLVGTGITAGVIIKGKGGKQIIEKISQKLTEVETNVKGLWDKYRGKTPKADETSKIQERIDAAKKQAEEIRTIREAEIRAEQEAIEKHNKLIEEAKRQREIKAAEEAAQKAKDEQIALAAQKTKKANWNFKYHTENSLAPFINPKSNIQNNTPMIKGESYSSYLARLREKESMFDIDEFAHKLEKTTPETMFYNVVEQLEKCHQNGGTITVDETVRLLSETKNTMSSTVGYLKELESSSYFSIERVKDKFKDYQKYVVELIREIEVANKEGEAAPMVVKKALKNIENKKLARKAFVEEITQNYERQLEQIRQQIKYDEANIPPVNKNVTLNREETQELAKELNEIIASGGTNPNFNEGTPLWKLNAAWKQKYISMPFSMKDKTGETAILDIFPRYESGFLRSGGDKYRFKVAGDFKYEPLYRQMHVENSEEFIKQFENIGGIYKPGRLQSCSKEKLYGEYWGRSQYGFTEWNPENNIKFVIHPKGPVSKAADIGEGKYGTIEAIYAANSEFRILGTVKKTVTPEEIQKGIPEFKNQFEDFEKYEIHLQEI